MTMSILENRLRREKPETAQQQEYVLREMLQEIALSGLARAGFFKKGVFQGGTCLRILYQLRRFSEDLDFVLKKANPEFSWSTYAGTLREEFHLYGVNLEIRDCAEGKTVRALFLKDHSLGKLLSLTHPLDPRRKLSIKLEIDCDPPRGATFETNYVGFPIPFSILTHTLESGFASKLHAILCRPYTKGRDWFDFIWYVERRTKPQLRFLQNALRQHGPWEGKRITVDAVWLHRALENRIQTIDWKEARRDVERFLEEPERRGLDVWNETFFLRETKLVVAGL
jgi:predicted nucleotidyltransferase component of viral defense system